MNQPTPLISIVTPARNMAQFIAETLTSALNQSVRDIEVIVVDDGSTDGTAKIVEGFGDPRIQLIRNPSGTGVSSARNKAMAAATAPYLLFLDADDVLMEGALAALLEPLKGQSRYVASMGRITCMTEAGEELPERPRHIRDVPDKDTLRHLLAKNFIQPGTLLVRTAAIREAGGFRADLAFGEDWEYWCRLALLGEFLPVPRVVLKYRVRPGGAHRKRRGSLLRFNRTAIDAVYGNADIARRMPPAELARLKRAVEMDIFWTGIRSELAFGSKLRAVPAGLVGLLRYPDSVLKPRLAYYFIRSIFSGETRRLARSQKAAPRQAATRR
jgi:glycosyltransferase involved in cell wall biosynthesis